MRLNTVNLATGNKFFIVENFFEQQQYTSIVELFDQYTAENPDWFEDPAYSHAYAGRMVYRGESATITKLQELAARPTTVDWVGQTVGQNLEYVNLSLWLDLPGYQVTPHYDQSSFEYAVQIYVPDPANFWEMLGTCVYLDDAVRAPLFEIHYHPNRGYLIDRTDTVKHGVNHAIPAQYRRQSVYLRYRIK
jgi:hypothetical protein